MKILMCTDGSKQAEDAITFGYPIAKSLVSKVTVLGVAEHLGDVDIVEKSLDNAEEFLKDLKVRFKLKLGYADEEIVRESEEGYDLVIIGSKGRRGLKRFLLGSTVMKVVKYVRISVLVVRGRPRTVSNILICTGGGERGIEDIKFGCRIARAIGAKVKLLHCMSQIPMLDLEEGIQVVPRSLAEKTPETEHLKKGLGILQHAGVEGEAKLRYGLVEDEIFSEVEEGGYDLLVIGAHATLGLSKYFLGDITSKIIEHVKVSVLVVKTPKHLI